MQELALTAVVIRSRKYISKTVPQIFSTIQENNISGSVSTVCF